jgi:hypothetical protein
LSLFIKKLKGEAPRVNYYVNGNLYKHGYYLAGGIYPEWAAFVKSIQLLVLTEKDKLFANRQESTKRTFSVLQSHFRILHQPTRLRDRGDLENIMMACIILHNMIVEDER